jgi:glycosyltransferase involved in cell wall biosynthesis
MNIVIRAYPLSSEYLRAFEKVTGSIPVYLILSELRRLPLPIIIAKLRPSGLENLFLPLEDINSFALLPILKMLAAVSNAKSRYIVTPGLALKPFSRLEAIPDLFNLVIASIQGRIALLKSGREIKSLLRLPLQEVKRPSVTRLLYLKTNLWYGVKAGGSVGHVAGVVNGFCRHGYALNFIASEPPVMTDPKVAFHRIKPLRTFGLPPEVNVYRFSNGLMKQIPGMSLTRPGFVYQRLSVGDYSGPVLARTFKVPLVIEYNGSEVWIAQKWGIPLRYHNLAVKAEEVCLRHAHLIVVVSEVLKEELVSRGFPVNRILVYPNCVDPEVFNPERFGESDLMNIRNQYGLSKETTVATFIGTFGEWHGVEVLAAAIRQMVEDDEVWLKKYRLHFLLVGDGLKMQAVRKTLADRRCQSYFTLAGLIPQERAPLYLAASDILLAPHVSNSDGSRFFGSPTKLFEYMAIGKGIIASDLEQIGEVLRNSFKPDNLPVRPPDSTQTELAVLCKPGDVRDLITGIRFLTERNLWRQHLGKNARQEVQAKYTWNKQVAAILDRVKRIGEV